VSAAVIAHAFGWITVDTQAAWDRVLAWVQPPWALTVEGTLAYVWHAGPNAEMIVADGADEDAAVLRLDDTIGRVSFPLVEASGATQVEEA
jgi:hypothetical protein